MRLLHTSDWHVGRPLRNQRRDDEYAAVLSEVLAIAIENSVDCILVAGDVFDSPVPTPDAERMVFGFFGDMVRAGIPAVVIAGNHDHPRRWNAYADLFGHLGIHVLGDPAPTAEQAIVKISSRDGTETATIASLPWLSERKVREFDDLMQGGKDIDQYAEQVSAVLKYLSKSLKNEQIPVLMAHVFVDGADVAPDSGERPLHIGQLYAVTPQMLPSEPAYIALGHVHKPQEFKGTNAYYSGSLLQCDFGEAGQKKRVNLVDVSPRKKAKIQAVELKSIRQLRNIGSAKGGVALDDLAAAAADIQPGDYVKVWVKADRPVPGLSEQVRELVPNAVDIVVERADIPEEAQPPSLQGMSPAELFTAYYESAHASAPRPELMSLFNNLLEEASVAPGQA